MKPHVSEYDEFLAELDAGRADAYELGRSAAMKRVRRELRTALEGLPPRSPEEAAIRSVIRRVGELEGRSAEPGG